MMKLFNSFKRKSDIQSLGFKENFPPKRSVPIICREVISTLAAAYAGIMYWLGAGAILATFPLATTLAWITVAGTMVASSLWIANRAKQNLGAYGTLKNNGHLINSRMAADPLKVVYGKLKVGGTWVFKGVSGANNEFFWVVIDWAEGTCTGIGKAVDTFVQFTQSETQSPPALNDLITGGICTLAAGVYKHYRVQIDGTGTPDTVKISNDGGATWLSTGVAITGGWQTVSDGVQFKSKNTTGHVLDTYWDWYAGDGIWIGERLMAYYQDWPGGSRISHGFYYGSPTQDVDPFLHAAFPDWNDAKRNTCYSIFFLCYDQEAWKSIPEFRILLLGRQIYDTRTSAWGYSTNPALVCFDWMTTQRFSLGIPTSLLVTSSINEAATWCDANGYTFNGVIADRREFLEHLEDILVNFRAFITETEGYHKLKIYTDDASVMSLEEKDIEIDPDTFEIFTPGIPETKNKVKCLFFDPNLGYTTNWATYENKTQIDADGDPREAEIPLNGTNDFSQATKLAKWFQLRNSLNKEFSIGGHQKCYPLEPGDMVSITHSFPGWISKKLRVKKIGIPQHGTLPMVLMDEDPSLYNQDVNVVGSERPLPSPPIYKLMTPTNPTESTGEDASNRARLDAYLILQIDDMGSSLSYEFRCRQTGTQGWRHDRVEDQGALTISTRIGGLPAGTEFEWQARSFIRGASLYSLWTTARSKTTWSPTGPGMTDVNVNALNQNNGIRVVWEKENEDPDLYKWLLYRNTSDDTGTAELISELSGRETGHFDSNVIAGENYYYWLKCEDRFGNVSDWSMGASVAPFKHIVGQLQMSTVLDIGSKSGDFGFTPKSSLLLEACDAIGNWTNSSPVANTISLSIEKNDLKEGTGSLLAKIHKYAKVRYYENGTNERALGDVEANKIYAQGFKLSGAKDIKAIGLKIRKTGSPGDLTVEIYSNSGGNPNTLLGSTTLNEAFFGTNYGINQGEFYYGAFTSVISLSADTLYWIVLSVAAADASNYWWIKGYYGAANPFGDASEILKIGSALGSLTAYNTYDINFRVCETGDYASRYIFTTIASEDLSPKSRVKFWAKALGLKDDWVAHLSLGESAIGEQDVVWALSADFVWEWKEVDITGISGADRNGITKIGIKLPALLSLDENWLYLDYFMANIGEGEATINRGGTKYTLMCREDKNHNASIRDIVRNLVIKNNATYPNSQVDISADEIVVHNLDGVPSRITDFSVTLDITGSGAGGLDIGSEAASTFYHIWAIYDEANNLKNGIFSVSTTVPTLPGTYAKKAYLGAIFNDGSNNLIKIYQVGHVAKRSTVYCLYNGSQTSPTSISLNSIVPSTAKMVTGIIGALYISAVGAVTVFAYFLTTVIGQHNSGNVRDATQGYAYANFRIPMINNAIYYTVSVSGILADIWVTGWEF